MDAVTAIVLYPIVSAKLWPHPEHKLDLLMGCNSFLINWTQSIFNSITQSYWNCFHLQSGFCFSENTIAFWAKIAVVKHIAVPMINIQGKPQEKLTYKWGSGLCADLPLLGQPLHSFLQEEHHSFYTQANYFFLKQSEVLCYTVTIPKLQLFNCYVYV